MENQTAKHFVLQLGALASLYLTLSFLLVLVFGLVNIMFPDASEGSWGIESAHSSVRLGIAMVIVFFPTYIILTHTVNTLRRKAEGGSYHTLTKWLIYLSLFVGGAVLLADLVAVIMAFLEGEITERFILKAASVLVVIGLAFFYYAQDAKGYWLKNFKLSIYYGVLATVIVFAFLVFGAMNIETPSEVREGKIDDLQVQDLMNLQWRVQEYVDLTESLPATLADIKNGVDLPSAPEGRAAYQYEVIDTGFKLCAEFKTESNPSDYFGYSRPMVEEKGTIANPDNWEHGTGVVCFERVVTR